MAATSAFAECSKVSAVKLTRNQRLIAVLACAGFTHEEIARQLGVSTATVSRALKRPAVKLLIGKIEERLVERIISELAEQFTYAAAEALQSLTHLLKSPEPHLQLRACELILQAMPLQEHSR